MNLKLAGQKLTLTDNFLDELGKGGFAAMELMKKRHPIWGNTPQDQNMDFAQIKKTLDQLVDLVNDSNLN